MEPRPGRTPKAASGSTLNFVVLHRGDQLAQVGYRLVEFGLADEVKRVSVFRRDLVGEKLEILSPLFGSQSRKRSFTMSEVGSKELARWKLEELVMLTLFISLTKVRECPRTRFPRSGGSTAL
jgi:hypothetical protein